MYENDEQYQQHLEQEQWDQHQRYEEQRREQEWMEHMHNCSYIAHEWLLGNCTEEEAEHNLHCVQDQDGLIVWAERVIEYETKDQS